MDKGHEYIRMCTAAEEIQRQWKQHYGDFYVAENGAIKCWISMNRDSRRVKRGFGIDIQNDIIYIAKYVWLPRQNQLIEMAQVPGRRYDSIVQDFFDWTKIPYRLQPGTPGKLFPSMEQIWLAFLMQQKYAKQWDGNQWRRPDRMPSVPS